MERGRLPLSRLSRNFKLRCLKRPSAGATGVDIEAGAATVVGDTVVGVMAATAAGDEATTTHAGVTRVTDTHDPGSTLTRVTGTATAGTTRATIRGTTIIHRIPAAVTADTMVDTTATGGMVAARRTPLHRSTVRRFIQPLFTARLL